MTCEEIQQYLTPASLIRTCAPPSGQNPRVRVQTLFRYHGGEYVDLFWVPGAAQEDAGYFSDLGQTMGQLLSMNVDPDSAVTRRHFIEDVCQDLSVQRDGGRFICKILDRSPQSVMSAFMRLGQACVRIADLFVTTRSRLTSGFGEDLQDGLESLDIPVEKGVIFPGRGGREVIVDFVVTGLHRQSAILTMTASNQSRAHDVANDIFTKWFDLQGYHEDNQFVTVVDSRKENLFRESDLTRIEIMSSVISYPDEADRLRDIVLA